MRVTPRFILLLVMLTILWSQYVNAEEGTGNTGLGDQVNPNTTTGSETTAPPDTQVTDQPVNATARTIYSIDDFGLVNVVDSWDGLAQESGSYMYVSATRELGRIPVRVKDHKFAINYATKSYLYADDEDPTVFYLRTPLFMYESGNLTIDLTIDLGNRLSFVEMMSETQPPDSIEGNVLKWHLENANGAMLLLKLSRNQPFLIPGEGGPQFNPRNLPYLTGDEIPRNADEVLRELETIILIAEKEGHADEDFIKLLKKNLSKLYYLYYLYGLVTEFEPAPES